MSYEHELALFGARTIASSIVETDDEFTADDPHRPAHGEPHDGFAGLARESARRPHPF